jgi:hypothetical protein
MIAALAAWLLLAQFGASPARAFTKLPANSSPHPTKI